MDLPLKFYLSLEVLMLYAINLSTYILFLYFLPLSSRFHFNVKIQVKVSL